MGSNLESTNFASKNSKIRSTNSNFYVNFLNPHNIKYKTSKYNVSCKMLFVKLSSRPCETRFLWANFSWILHFIFFRLYWIRCISTSPDFILCVHACPTPLSERMSSKKLNLLQSQLTKMKRWLLRIWQVLWKS